jgi:hypothetical protein
MESRKPADSTRTVMGRGHGDQRPDKPWNKRGAGVVLYSMEQLGIVTMAAFEATDLISIAGHAPVTEWAIENLASEPASISDPRSASSGTFVRSRT